MPLCLSSFFRQLSYIYTTSVLNEYQGHLCNLLIFYSASFAESVRQAPITGHCPIGQSPLLLSGAGSTNPKALHRNRNEFILTVNKRECPWKFRFLQMYLMHPCIVELIHQEVWGECKSLVVRHHLKQQFPLIAFKRNIGRKSRLPAFFPDHIMEHIIRRYEEEIFSSLRRRKRDTPFAAKRILPRNE